MLQLQIIWRILFYRVVTNSIIFNSVCYWTPNGLPYKTFDEKYEFKDILYIPEVSKELTKFSHQKCPVTIGILVYIKSELT